MRFPRHKRNSQFNRAFVRILVCAALAAGVTGVVSHTQSASTLRPASARTWYVAPWGHNWSPGSVRSPLATVNRAINLASSGDTILLRGGTYHQRVVVSKDNLVIRNYPGEHVWFDGSSRVTGWKRSGSIWVRGGWKHHFDHSPTYNYGAAASTANGWGFVNPKHPMAAWPDQVWVNGTRMRQVSSVSRVSKGKFYVSYSTNKLYLGTSPKGRQVRASTLSKAFTVRGENTLIRGIGIMKYAASIPHMGAVTLERPGITLSHVKITQCATTGVSAMADHITLSHVTSTRNGMLGIHASSAYYLHLNRVNASGNNVERFNQAPVSGGIKVHRSRHVTIENSMFMHNHATGIWFDVSDYDITLVRNRVMSNSGHGIFLEISDTAQILDNLIGHNRGDGILIDNTGHVQIWNNTIMSTGRPIDLVQDSRLAANMNFPGYDPRQPEPDPTVPWITQDVEVHNNVISTPNSAANCLLCVEDFTHQRSAAEMGVVSDGNAYRRRGPTDPTWLVVWSSGSSNPYVYTTLKGFRYATTQEQHGRLASTAIVTSAGHPTDTLRAMTSTVARPLPSSIAAVIGKPAGSLHLGYWFS